MLRAQEFSLDQMIGRYETLLTAALWSPCRISRLSLASSFSRSRSSRRGRCRAARGQGSWGWIEWFTISQVFWGVLLFLPGSQGYRVYIRAFPYVMSLIALGGVRAVQRRRNLGARRALDAAAPLSCTSSI